MRLRKSIGIVVVLTLVLAGCSSPQATFDKSFELANQSYQSGDFAMAKAHIDDALLALPDSAAGKELQQRIAYATFSQETLVGVQQAASAGDWQSAMTLALKLDSNHPDEATANQLATESINTFLTSFSASKSLDDRELDGLQISFSELLAASQDASELAINQAFFESARAVLGEMQASRIRELINRDKFEDSLDLALTLEFSKLYISNSVVEQAISRAKRSFETSTISKSRALANSKKFDEASKLVRLALTELPGSDALDSELSRVVKLSQQEQERQAREAQKARDRAVSAMVSVKDTFEDIEWIHDRATYSQYAGNKFELYMGRRNQGTPWLRLRFMMYDDTWHFFETIKLDVDGVRYSYAPGYFEVDRDNGGGDIWEWYDFSPTASDIRMVEAIIKSKSTRIRYINKDNFYVERTVSSSQKKALGRVLLAFEALGGTRP